MARNLIRKRRERPLNATILFPELQRELEKNPRLCGNLKGYFIVTVKKKGEPKAEWYLLFQGQEKPPVISSQRPAIPQQIPPDAERQNADSLPVVLIEIEDSDLLNFITGGLTGWGAIVSGKAKIAGDLMLAQKMEEVFKKAGGVEKVLGFLKANKIQAPSKL
ncbi:uncharacterized protein VTP21DRAFT_9980 [Calcarisporiella thermophila]|uniref:uncharacterized protein n=1 Tax=Calcarisporiella thermophila TaxID=911321 RepID=UPI003743338C